MALNQDPENFIDLLYVIPSGIRYKCAGSRENPAKFDETDRLGPTPELRNARAVSSSCWRDRDLQPAIVLRRAVIE
ncbi:MAG TPA: hypothetical protein VK524_32345 [Polyangiaceae bacterium]|nr:hypothetical protein [Polyangiaceae bacterium]